MPSKSKNSRKQTNSTKKSNPSLHLVLKRLDEKIDQRFDALDRRIDTVDRKVDAVDQKVDAVWQETTAEFKAVRAEMTQMRQENTAEFKAVRGEMTQGFDVLWQQFKAEMKHVSDAAYEHYLRIETDAKSRAEYYQQSLNNLQTAMDTAAKNYDDFKENRDRFDAGIRELQQEVKELKKRDMEKAAAIEKIEEQLKAA